MNRRGDETLELAAERFMLSILARRAPVAFGPPSKMCRAAVSKVMDDQRWTTKHRVTMAIRSARWVQHTPRARLCHHGYTLDARRLTRRGSHAEPHTPSCSLISRATSVPSARPLVSRM